MNSEKFLFIHIMNYVPRYYFDKCVDKYDWNKGIKSLSCRSQFLALSFGQFTKRDSLRDIIISLNSAGTNHYHLGFQKPVRRSTLAEANEKRNWRIYADFAKILIKKARKVYTKNSPIFREISEPIYALDASTIDLCLNVFKWAHFKKTKWAIKLHTLLDLRWNIPSYIYISDWKLHDVNILDKMNFESGAFYIMDKWYFCFWRLYNINVNWAFFLIRFKKDTVWKRLYSRKYKKGTGVKYDQVVKLYSEKWKKEYLEKVRRIKYYDSEQKKYYYFMTNNFDLDAQIIADLYKQRWQVELFFKWIKQHLKIKKFWWYSENAVKIQVWIAICSYLIVAIMKKELWIKESMYEILQILSFQVCNKVALNSLFEEKRWEKYRSWNWTCSQQLKIGSI